MGGFIAVSDHQEFMAASRERLLIDKTAVMKKDDICQFVCFFRSDPDRAVYTSILVISIITHYWCFFNRMLYYIILVILILNAL